ncbi:GvpL/GvpF family gas vesicle protein [Sulfitobacter sp. JB4-11]|uniref:GvpL/GvpF family gas vesicle protein n=1 Tax=Sulfitobacter rhodophyticola TaxID=3238304 RepID=UPI003A777EE2
MQLFEAGVDFLPFAPRASYCTSVVRRLTLNQMNDLQARLKKTSGYGQLTVRLTAQRLDMDGSPDVPSWLRSRQILQARRREQEKVLEAAMVEIMRGAESAAATAPLVRHNQCTCHLLIPRQAQDRFKSLIAKRAAAFSGIVRNLDVTGLWPPYAFSEITAATKQKDAA